MALAKRAELERQVSSPCRAGQIDRWPPCSPHVYVLGCVLRTRTISWRWQARPLEAETAAAEAGRAAAEAALARVQLAADVAAEEAREKQAVLDSTVNKHSCEAEAPLHMAAKFFGRTSPAGNDGTTPCAYGPCQRTHPGGRLSPCPMRRSPCTVPPGTRIVRRLLQR